MKGRPLLALLLALTAACSTAGPGRPAPPTAPAPTQAPGPAPVEVVRFARLRTLVSAEVRNPNRALGLGVTRFRLTVRDAAGGVVARVGPRERPGPVCCTLYALPPLATHGVYVDIGPRAARAARVEIELVEPRWVRWAAARRPSAAMSRPALRRVPGSAYVVGRVVARGLPLADVAVQASLEDATGRLVAVISALLACYRDGVPRQSRVELFHPVPPGTRLGPVRAYAFPAGSLPDTQLPPCR